MRFKVSRGHVMLAAFTSLSLAIGTLAATSATGQNGRPPPPGTTAQPPSPPPAAQPPVRIGRPAGAAAPTPAAGRPPAIRLPSATQTQGAAPASPAVAPPAAPAAAAQSTTGGPRPVTQGTIRNVNPNAAQGAINPNITAPNGQWAASLQNVGGMLDNNPVQSIICLSENKDRDSARVDTNGDVKILTVRCNRAIVNGVARSVTSGAVFFERSLPSRTYNARGILRGRGPVIAGADACATEFERYKSQPNAHTFQARWQGLRLVCRAGPWEQVQPGGIVAYTQRPGPQGFNLRYHPRIDGVVSNIYHSTSIYLGTGPAPAAGSPAPSTGWFTPQKSLVFYNSGPMPNLRSVYLQVIAGNAPVPPSTPMTCTNWANTPGSLGWIRTNASARPAEAWEKEGDPPIKLGDIANLHVVGIGLTPEVAHAINQKLGAAQAGWLRVIPSNDTTDALRCIRPPGGWIRIVRQEDPAIVANAQANQQIAAYLQARQQFLTQAEAAYNQAKSVHESGANKAPFTVEVVGYVPPNNGRRARVALPFSAPKGLNMTPAQLQDPNNWQTATTFSLSDSIPWDNSKRDNWTAGCLYDPYALHYAVQTGPRGPQGFLEWVTTIWNMYVVAFDMLKQSAVELVSYAVTFGQCPFNDPTGAIPAEPQPAACGAVKGAIKTGLNYAMAAYGIPPHLPSSNEMMQDGAAFLAAKAVSYAVTTVSGVDGETYASLIPDSARQAATNALADQMLEAAEISKCAYPARGLEDAQEKGYDGFNPITGCGIVNTMPGADFNAMGKATKSPSGTDTTAVMWVRVRRNGNWANNAPTASLSVTISTPNLPSGQIAPSILQRLQAANGLTMFKHNPIQLDTSIVPPEGLIVPITIYRDLTMVKHAVQQANVCAQNAFYPGCVENMALYVLGVTMPQPHTFGINLHYRFTSNTAVTNPCTTINGYPVCTSFPGMVNKTQTVTAPLNRVAFGTYGIHPLQGTAPACPGFQIVTDPVSGLQDVDSTVDMHQLELGE